MVDEGLPASDFETWAETQEMVPWPAGDGVAHGRNLALGGK